MARDRKRGILPTIATVASEEKERMDDKRDAPGESDEAIHDAPYYHSPDESHPFREWGFNVRDTGGWWYRGRCEVDLDPFDEVIRLYIGLPNGYTIQAEIKPGTLEGRPPRNVRRFPRPQ
jgi:hypothetical protein